MLATIHRFKSFMSIARNPPGCWNCQIQFAEWDSSFKNLNYCLECQWKCHVHTCSFWVTSNKSTHQMIHSCPHFLEVWGLGVRTAVQPVPGLNWALEICRNRGCRHALSGCNHKFSIQHQPDTSHVNVGWNFSRKVTWNAYSFCSKILSIFTNQSDRMRCFFSVRMLHLTRMTVGQMILAEPMKLVIGELMALAVNLTCVPANSEVILWASPKNPHLGNFCQNYTWCRNWTCVLIKGVYQSC